MNSVQLTKLIKSLVYEKATKSVENCLNGSDINKFILSVYANKSIKVKPFNFIESVDVYIGDSENSTHDGVILKEMFLDSTKTIEKEFNKNRKLFRVFRDLYTNNKKSILGGILNDDIMQSLVKVFFLDTETLTKIGLDVCDHDIKELLADRKTIEVLRKYVVCLVATDIRM